MSVSNINSYIKAIKDWFLSDDPAWDPDKITCEVDGQQVNCETWEPDNNHY